jgi:hypothetical protein
MSSAVVNTRTDILMNVILDLKTIGGIEQGQKIDTINGTFLSVYQNSYISGAARSFAGDSRNRTIEILRNRLFTAIEFADRILESKYLTVYDVNNLVYTNISNSSNKVIKEHMNNFNLRLGWLYEILVALNDSVKGLNNIRSTYSKDPDISNNLNVMRSKVMTFTNYLSDQITLIKEQRNDFIKEMKSLKKRSKLDKKKDSQQKNSDIKSSLSVDKINDDSDSSSSEDTLTTKLDKNQDTF